MPKKRGFLDGYKTYDASHGFGSADEWRKAFHQRMSKEEAAAILERHNETAHEVLGVNLNATEAEIRSAFRRLIQQWHPDKNPDRQEEALQMSLKIIAAYESLK
ncbi:J domain-containing protein [Puia sp. P3]|jgi:DnaJ-class molecular chaperone|uniref:J domain-containing protein n=1 Tax=Puia sp. P3 TaxID=3423952 RepID=UPI003D6675FF